MNVVEFHNVTKKRKDFSIDNLNITVPQGYITGFIGPNGSGKTSTIHMMMDILQVDEGDIQLFGTSHKDRHHKQKVGFVYDELYMYKEFNIKKIRALIAPLYETWNEDLFKMYLEQFDLPFKKKIKHFSKGMKMKCSLLFALAHEPEFIVMDEPTSGLDPIFRRELMEIIQDLMVHENQTIFLSTHITTDLDQIADFVIFIYQGNVLLKTSMEEVREKFHVVKGSLDLIDADTKSLFTGIRKSTIGFTALFEGDPALFEPFGNDLVIEKATLEDVMYFISREEP